jgi:hypothetical protein
MLLSAYAMLTGKWAIAGMAILGWCCWATPAITRTAGNPGLTLAARRQMIILALVCIIPLLTIVVFISFSKDNEGNVRTRSEKHLECRVLDIEECLPADSQRDRRTQLPLPSRAMAPHFYSSNSPSCRSPFAFKSETYLLVLDRSIAK